jgi:hypothetical protein
MVTDLLLFDPASPRTNALRNALAKIHDQNLTADLLFLERWEICPVPGTAIALRVSQLRRANPELAAAIRAEVGRVKQASRALPGPARGQAPGP